MKKDKSRIMKKMFIEQTIGTRKYFGYRADLVLYKMILCIFIFLIIYLLTMDIFISIIMAVQVFIIFTLINKMRLERKEKEGKSKLLKKAKIDYFIDKITNCRYEEFENLVKYFLEKQGVAFIEKIDKYTYIAKLEEKNLIIRIFKMYKGAELEKMDIRKYLLELHKYNIDQGQLVTINNLTEEAQEFYKNIPENLNVKLVDTKLLFEMSENHNLLPEVEIFYEKVMNEKTIKKDENLIKTNVLNSKKIATYFMSAVFFYILAKFFIHNTLGVYISYYFIILGIINAIWVLFNKIKYQKSEAK